MGYAVYEDRAAQDHGVTRWAGYGVPAVCDHPECDAKIDRGMGYQCEEVTVYTYLADGVAVESHDDWDDEVEEQVPGCHMYFCGSHAEHAAHRGSTPKPDTAEWERHMLTDDSWARWRDENPEQTAAMRRRTNQEDGRHAD